jgi:hypothetical protein
MVRHLATGILPQRRDLINPRVVKVKMSNYAKNAPNTTPCPHRKNHSLRQL